MNPKMITRSFMMAGLVLVGCNSEDPSASSAGKTGPGSTLESALVAGRVAVAPQGLVVRELTVSAAAMTQRESVKQLAKATRSVAQVTDPEETAQRILEQHQQVPLTEDVSLTLELPKADYVLGEPVVVRATIKNTSDHIKRFPTQLDPQFQFNAFLITSPTGKLLGYSPVALACTRGHMLDETVMPGEEVVRDIPLFFGNSGWVFTEIGEYRLQALYRGLNDDAARVDSNVIAFTVDPGTEADQRAADLLMDHDQGLFLTWGEGDHLEDGIAALRRVVDEYPGTIAALHARYALGSNMSVEFFDGRFNQHRQPVPAAVVSYLAPLAEALRQGDASEVPPSMLEGTFGKLATAYERLGRQDDAREARAVLSQLQNSL